MLKEQAKLFSKAQVVIDVMTIAIAFVVAYLIRGAEGGLGDFKSYLWVLMIALPVLYILFHCFGLYVSQRMQTLPSVLLSLMKAHAVGGMAVSSCISFIAPAVVSRLLFGYFIIISLVFVCLERTAFKVILSSLREKGYNFRNFLIVGTGKSAQQLANMIRENDHWGLRVIGMLSYDREPDVKRGCWLSGFGTHG